MISYEMIKIKTKERWIKHIFLSALLLLITVLFPGCSQTKRFKTSDLASFYIVGEKGITGYQIQNGIPQPIVQTRTTIVRKNINTVVHRAQLEDRYLVFTEDGWPTGRQEGVISIDFKNGVIRSLDTRHNAYTSAGSSNKYYFAFTSGEDSDIWVYNAQLEEVSSMKLDPPVILSDFYCQADKYYGVGVDIDLSEDISGNSYFKTRAFEFDLKNENLTVKSVTELNVDPKRQYWLDELVVRKNQFYAVNAGWRDNTSEERNYAGSVYRYDLKENAGEFFPLEEIGPSDAYFPEDSLMAITHSSSLGATRKGITLFDLGTCENSFIDLEQLGFSLDGHEIHDIQSLDSTCLLLLTSEQLIGYDMKNEQIAFEISCNKETGTPFHIWISPTNLPAD